MSYPHRFSFLRAISDLDCADLAWTDHVTDHVTVNGCRSIRLVDTLKREVLRAVIGLDIAGGGITLDGLNILVRDEVKALGEAIGRDLDGYGESQALVAADDVKGS